MKNLSVIIVSWNCKEYLRECLTSIVKHPPKCSYEIVLVDNASTDGTVEMALQSFPDIRIIRNDYNKGFAAANNIALKQCESIYYLLLNPDTEVYENSLQMLIDAAEQYPDAWGIGPAIINGDETPQRTGVCFPNNWNILVEALFLDRIFPYTIIFGKQKELYKDYSVARNVDYLQGSCLLIKDEAIKEIGVLDSEYFMYFEETDWCYRVKEARKKILYYPNATVKHYGGGETGHYDDKRIISYHRSLLLFYKKNYVIIKTIILRVILALRSVLRLCIWSLVIILMPSIKKKAVSSCRGYFNVLLMVFKRIN